MILEIVLTFMVAIILLSPLWMIEYAERCRVIQWYEKSYIENGIRYVREAKPGLVIPVRYAIYRLKDGELTFERDCD